MSNNPGFKTYLGLAALLGLWALLFAYYGSAFLYHPGEIETPAYPLIATEEAAPDEQPAETAAVEPQAPAVIGIAALLADADSGAGQKVSKKCTACHSFDKGGKNKVGPNLWDVVDRTVAGGEGYKFSGALAGLGGEWTYDRLDAFLMKPKEFAAGTKMSFSGIRGAGDRANLIAYLRDLSDDPKPLP